MQYKHVNTSVAAYSTARMLAGLSGISVEAHCLLLRALVMDENINVKGDTGKELIKADFAMPYGQIKNWVKNHASEALTDLLANAGNNLLPQDHPVAIEETLHRLVPGGCRLPDTARDAEEIMRNTPFRLNRHVFGLVCSSDTLTKEQEYVKALYLSQLFNTDQMYFPVSYDYRGRMYYRGGAITPQGDDMQKGLLEFAEGQPLGQFGLVAIEMALADAIGCKLPKTEVRQHLNNGVDLEDIANDPNCYGYLASALAHEYCQARAMDNPAEFISHVVCHQDATCSGLQIAAAITGHRQTAELTNCTASHKSQPRKDVYGAVSKQVATDYPHTSLGALCTTYGRALVKKTVMTLGYGAGKNTLKRAVVEFLLEKAGKRIELAPDQDTDEMTAADWLDQAMVALSHTEFKLDWEDGSEDALFEALDSNCGATVSLMDQLKTAVEARLEVNGWDRVRWHTHDGFETSQKQRQATERAALGAVKVKRGYELDVGLNATAIAPNLVHSLDAAQMREAIRIAGVPCAAIHDSIGTRAADYWVMAIAVRDAFVKIEPRRIAQEFLEATEHELELLGDYDPSEARQSSYFWC
jgi:DNA-directed RNA polymerase